MRRRINLLISVLIFPIITGCVSQPSPTEIAGADYGLYPSNYEIIVKSYMEASLKDPFSTQYKLISFPEKYWIGGGLERPGVYGYRACVTYNAKNSFGAYVGYKTVLMLIKNNSVVKTIENATNYLGSGRNLCEQAKNSLT